MDRSRDGAQRRFEAALARATVAELGTQEFREAMTSVREIHEELNALDREVRERGRRRDRGTAPGDTDSKPSRAVAAGASRDGG